MSNISSLPASALVLIFDYLSAVALMDSRQVCKKWHQVIEEKPSLWNFFYFPDDLHWKIEFKQSMFDFFTKKSGGLVKVDIEADLEPSDDLGEEALLDHQNAPDELLEGVLKSKDTLQSLAYKGNGFDAKLTPEVLFQLEKLHTYIDDDPYDQGDRGRAPLMEVRKRKYLTPIRILNPSEKVDSFLTFLYLGGSFWNGEEALEILEKTSRSLRYLYMNIERVPTDETLEFPHLETLELAHNSGEFPDNFDCPILKEMIFYPNSWFEFSGDFPVSITKISVVPPLFGGDPSINDNWLDHLTRDLPNLETFVSDFVRKDEEWIQFLEARKEAAEEGDEIKGHKMKPLKKLILDIKWGVGKETLEELKELVEMVHIEDELSVTFVPRK